MKKDIIAAHKFSSHHREELTKSNICGCFFCLRTFNPIEINEWIDEWSKEGKDLPEGQTALCPKCGIDSVIGSASGYPIEQSFLKKMKNHWFNS